ncbi:putative gustatory receptor 22a [Drosophila tropicalis]|uniref:putative gustatory receptor 22a n=1 Tax=Drosophila tropicalis TaxID=46794 RepID=UPI0035AC153C
MTLRRKFSQELGDVLNELIQIDKVHFNKRSLEESISKFDYYVIQKSLSTIGEVLSTVIVHLGLPGHKNLVFPLIMSCIVHVGILLVIMHFYLVILFIYRYIWIINRELLDLANKLRGNSHIAFPRLRLLLSLFSRLLKLNSRAGGIYDYQMILMMCTVLGSNIVATYFLIVHTVSPKKTFTTLKLFLFSQALFINTWDFWLSIAVCDLAERTAQNTATILRLFSDIDNMDIELDRRLNNFSMFCSHRKLRFYHCGLFDVNYRMGFQMIITSVLYLLFLVQFDYMNL